MAQTRGGGAARSHLDTTRFFQGLSAQHSGTTGRYGRTQTIRSYATSPMAELYGEGPGSVAPNAVSTAPAAPADPIGRGSGAPGTVSAAVNAEGTTNQGPAMTGIESAVAEAQGLPSAITGLPSTIGRGTATNVVAGMHDLSALTNTITSLVSPVSVMNMMNNMLGMGLSSSQAIDALNSIAEQAGLTPETASAAANVASSMSEANISPAELTAQQDMTTAQMADIDPFAETEQADINNQAITDMLSVFAELEQAPQTLSAHARAALTNAITGLFAEEETAPVATPGIEASMAELGSMAQTAPGFSDPGAMESGLAVGPDQIGEPAAIDAATAELAAINSAGGFADASLAGIDPGTADEAEANASAAAIAGAQSDAQAAENEGLVSAEIGTGPSGLPSAADLGLAISLGESGEEGLGEPGVAPGLGADPGAMESGLAMNAPISTPDPVNTAVTAPTFSMADLATPQEEIFINAAGDPIAAPDPNDAEMEAEMQGLMGQGTGRGDPSAPGAAPGTSAAATAASTDSVSAAAAAAAADAAAGAAAGATGSTGSTGTGNMGGGGITGATGEGDGGGGAK